MPLVKSNSLHPVRVVSQRTGLSPDVLRAWEKRYDVVQPHRSSGGQRLYSDADLERLSLLARAIAGGRSIGHLAKLSLRELEDLITADETERANSARTVEGRQLKASCFLSLAMNAISALDRFELEDVLRRATMHLSTIVAVDEVIVPLLHEVGRRWEKGEISPAHEHLGSATVRRVLAWMGSGAVVPANAPVAVVGTPADQRHELGAKIVATTTCYESWKVIYVGSDLPAESITIAARQANARLVALSLIYPVNSPHLLEQLKEIRNTLQPEVLVVTGGAGAVVHKAVLNEWGIRVLNNLRDYRILLRSLHPAPLAV